MERWDEFTYMNVIDFDGKLVGTYTSATDPSWDTEPIFTGFSFKKVGVPKEGVTKELFSRSLSF